MATKEEDLGSLNSSKSGSFGSGSDGEEELDPRVQEELECLNSASDEINKLEIELEHARNKFRSLMTDATQNLNLLYKKLGRCINKTRTYYVLSKEAKRAQTEAQKSVVNFQRANSIYQAAKETVALAEERVIDPAGEQRQFDSAWQEMLNHATMKFMESEKDKAKSEEEHLRRAAECAEIETRLKKLEKDMPRNIAKARPYFELKDQLEYQLQLEKLNVEDLQRALAAVKKRYRAALTNLESISEEVHHRRQIRNALPPRTPGVGAEFNDSNSDLPSINLDIASLSEFSECSSVDSFNIQNDMDEFKGKIHRVPSRGLDMHAEICESGIDAKADNHSLNSSQGSGDLKVATFEQGGKVFKVPSRARDMNKEVNDIESRAKSGEQLVDSPEGQKDISDSVVENHDRHKKLSLSTSEEAAAAKTNENGSKSMALVSENKITKDSEKPNASNSHQSVNNNTVTNSQDIKGPNKDKVKDIEGDLKGKLILTARDLAMHPGSHLRPQIPIPKPDLPKGQNWGQSRVPPVGQSEEKNNQSKETNEKEEIFV